jgi:endo-1,4-beta-xylanase
MSDIEPSPNPTEADRQRAEAIFQLAGANVRLHRQSPANLVFQSPSGQPLVGLNVQIEQKSQKFLFGNLVFDLVWGEPPYRPELFKERFLELFNFAIFPFYWSSYEKAPGRMEWQRMLPTLEWCLANGVTPKGHPLVWPYSAGIPEWLYEVPEAAVEALTRARVTSIVQGFSQSIQTWDVTNEAVNHVGWDEAVRRAFQPSYHEIALWRGIEVAGGFKREIPISEAAGWVERSLEWAYAANPRATFIVNDYNQEIDPHVRQRFFDLIAELQRRKAPISGIGLQVHPVNHWIWPQELWDTLDLYAALDLPVHITELHQPASEEAIEGGWRQGSWTQEAQAEFVSDLYRLCFGHPSVVSINYWGLSDRNIWIPKSGLVDDEYHPKPVFNALKDLVKGEWLTPPQTLVTNTDGRVEFCGYHGEYEITVASPGIASRTFGLALSPDEANLRTFTI